MEYVVLSPLVGDIFVFLCAGAPLPRNSIRHWCLYVAHRAGISGIALLENNFEPAVNRQPGFRGEGS